MDLSNLKYITYCRKSTEDSTSQILSIQSQQEELEDFSKVNNLKVVDIYNESHTASKIEKPRPVFNEVMNLIESGRANALLIWKFDRASRNSRDTSRIINAISNGQLLEIRTPFETFKKGDNILLLYIYFGMADEYSRQLSANVKRGNRAKLKLGQYPSKAPLGFRNFSNNGVKNIEPDENAPMIKDLFIQYATGEKSLSRIRDYLNEDFGVRTNRKTKFSKSSVKKILLNKTYYGVISRNGEDFKGSFEPIISKSLYDQVQEVMISKTRPRSKKHNFTYKLKLRCMECDSYFTGEVKNKYYKRTDRQVQYTYYSCSKKTGKCSQKPITAEELDRQFIKIISKYKFDVEEWNIAKDLLILDLKKKYSYKDDLIQTYNTEISKLENKKNALLDLRTEGEVTKEEYIKKKSEYIDKISLLEGKIKGSKKFTEEKFGLLENFAETIIQARNIMVSKDSDKKRNLIISLCSDLFILDGRIKISFKKPFSFYFREDLVHNKQTMCG